MKFANLQYKRSGLLTIGDDIQVLAIKYLYEYMNIDYNDVVRIGYDELYSYDGEYVILPISFPLFGYHHGCEITQFSNKIIPVFLGVSLLATYLSEEDVAYFRRFQPIGCRDEHTMNTLRKYNIMAYLNGCMTATFPQRREHDDADKYRKIFCVDVNDEIKKYIPKDLLELCEFTSHSYELNAKCDTEEIAKNVYEKYINEAKLVITTLLHAAIPCVAAGIPVIFLKDKFSFRFAGVDKLVKIYSKEEYGNINWNHIIAVNFEDKKEQILQSATKRLMDTYNYYSGILDISSFYEGDSKNKRKYYIEFVDNTIEYIEKHWKKSDYFEYALWCVTQTAVSIYEYISNNYPNAKLVAVVDKNKRVNFCGKDTQDIDWIIENKEPFVFVCAGAAVPAAYKLFKELNKTNFYQCCDDLKYEKKKEFYQRLNK